MLSPVAHYWHWGLVLLFNGFSHFHWKKSHKVANAPSPRLLTAHKERWEWALEPLKIILYSFPTRNTDSTNLLRQDSVYEVGNKTHHIMQVEENNHALMKWSYSYYSQDYGFPVKAHPWMFHQSYTTAKYTVYTGLKRFIDWLVYKKSSNHFFCFEASFSLPKYPLLCESHGQKFLRNSMLTLRSV